MDQYTDRLMQKFYSTIEPADRKAVLMELEAIGKCAETENLRRLFEMRYIQSDKSPDEYADLFLKFWMDMWMRTKTSGTSFSKKRNRKEVLKEYVSLGIPDFKENGGSNLLYKELCHLVELFIHLCEHDKRYTHILQGFVSIPKEQVQKKTAQDVRETGILFIEENGLEKELAEWEAATETVLKAYEANAGA